MPQKFHLIGICGVAMATLAVMLKQRGYQVSGSDEGAFAPMSEYLKKHSIPIFTPYSPANLKHNPDIVVIGNSQSRGNAEVEFVLERKIAYFSMPEVIKNYFLKDNLSLVVSGTHGKTTVSSLVSYLLKKLGEPIGFFVGGASQNSKIYGEPCSEKNQVFVIEGDEYDSSFFDKKSKFFHYFPHYLIINNIELDHIDIFRDEADIVQNFHFLTRQVPPNGVIFANYDDPNVREATAKIYCNIVRFGRSKQADYQITDIEFSSKEKQSLFTLKHKDKEWEIRSPLLGLMNIYNTTAAVLVCIKLGYPITEIQKHLSSFQNAKRRLELKTNNPECLVYDDFAHHPTAIKQTIETVRHFHPNYKIFAVYEPKSNTSIHKTYENILHQSFENADTVCFFKNKKLENFDTHTRLDLNKVCGKLEQKGKDAFQFKNTEKLQEFLKIILEQKTIFLFLTQGALNQIPQNIARFADKKYQ
jgi:UDP-N-acetylmuramate: L-alanyl-gamma-D-glutamyl-meso-diaminopimelate ligase